MRPDTPDHFILLFDGVCNLCNATVQFVIRRDKDGRFRFAALQSDIGRDLLQKFEINDREIDSVVLIADGSAYVRSDAALLIAKKLGGFWALFYVFRGVPTRWRDRIYDWIARNRYRWFGRKEYCMVPTPELKERFL